MGPTEKRKRAVAPKKRKLSMAALRSFRDYVKRAAPEPEVLRLVGEASKRRGTDKLTLKEIDRVIQVVRKQMKERERR